MCEFVAAYTKPNGRAPLIGDADDGRVQKLGHAADQRSPLPAVDRGGRCSIAATSRRAAGRCWDESFWLLGPDAPAALRRLPTDGRRARSIGLSATAASTCCATPAAHVVVDCGEVGMRGRGGHGHNDILSFELFLNGFNVVTDCGAYLYTASREWRNRFRSTAFHNTVQVDGEELNRFLAPDALWQLPYDAHAGRRVRCAAAKTSTAFAAAIAATSGSRRPSRTRRECFVDSSDRACSFATVSMAPASTSSSGDFISTRTFTPSIDGCDVRLSCDGRRGVAAPGRPARPVLRCHSSSAGCRRVTASKCRRRCSSGRLARGAAASSASYLFAESPSRRRAAERPRAAT